MTAAKKNGRKEKTYRVTDDGIAVIPVLWTLVSRGGVLPSSGITTYSGIRQRLKDAVESPEVRGIVLDFDCPGGMVSNVDDTAQLIREVSKIKPVWALAYDQMTSGAYWLASAANRIIATQSAQVGSIGVLVMHADCSQQLSNAGVNVTFIHAGSRKVEGNPCEPLPKALHERIQTEVNETYERFTGRVAEYRGLSQQAVKNTEAGVFSAAQAITLNLVDEVMPADDVFDHFSRHLDSTGGIYRAVNSNRSQGANTMPKPNQSADESITSDQIAATKPLDGGELIAGTLESVELAGEAEPLTAHATTLLELCETADLSFMASALIKGGVTEEQAQSQLAEAGKIRDVCAAAGLEASAETIIKECGLLSAGVHKAIGMAITEAKAAADPEQHAHQPSADTTKTVIKSADIYGNRKTR